DVLDGDSGLAERAGGAAGRENLESRRHEPLHEGDHPGLVADAHQSAAGKGLAHSIFALVWSLIRLKTHAGRDEVISPAGPSSEHSAGGCADSIGPATERQISRFGANFMRTGLMALFVLAATA